MLRLRAVGAVLALAAGAGAAFAVAAPGAGAPSTASFTATDPPPTWVAGGGGDTATIAAGGTVTFSYPSGSSLHNVVFDTSPTSCTQTTGIPSTSVPPLPENPQGPAWAGSCRFDTPGTYTFHCGFHGPSMSGTVIVEGSGSTTGTTGTGGSTSSTGTSGTTTPGSGNSTAPTAKPHAKVTRRQTGTTVRGSVTTPAGASKIVVTAFVSNRQLSKHRPKKAKRVRVGSQTKHSTGTAGTSFAVKLNATARRALHRRHRLSVSVRIVVTPTTGSAATTTATVTLRE